MIEIIEVFIWQCTLHFCLYFEIKPVKTKLNRFIIIKSKKSNKGERYIKAFNEAENGALLTL